MVKQVIGRLFDDRGNGPYWEFWSGYCWEAKMANAQAYGPEASKHALDYVRSVHQDVPPAYIVRLLHSVTPE